MKILHIIDSGGLYGAEVMLLQLMRQQQNLGHVPVLASIGNKRVPAKAIETEAKKLGLKVELFRMLNGPNFFGALSILRFAQSIDIDVLHSHGYKSNILLGLLPHRLRKLPLLSTVHGWTSHGRLTKMAVYEWLDKVCLKKIDRVVMVNPLMRQLPALRHLNNTAVIENGIDPVMVDAVELDKEILQYVQQRATIVAVGRLSPEKGFNYLIDAVAQLVRDGHDVQLLLLGEGGLRQELRDQANALRLTKYILMPGYIGNVVNYLSRCTVFAMPSLTEGLPIALLEAMQAGIPVVASQVGGIPDVLDNGRAGTLVSPADVESLAAALSQLLVDGELADKCVKAARQRVTEKYSSRTMAEKYLTIYAQLITEQPSATTVGEK